MEKIIIIERSRELDNKAVNVIKDNLSNVLGNRFIIEEAYIDELDHVSSIKTNLVIIPIYSILPNVVEKIKNYNQQILLATRTFKKSSLKELEKIPSKTNVLVVNASIETSNDIVRLLYEQGFYSCNFVAYKPGITDLSNFRIAVTPGEKDLVPISIEKIIDIGYRVLDAQTFLNLFTKLKINDSVLNENLLRYIEDLAPKNNDVEERFINSIFLNKAIEEVVEFDTDGVLIMNIDCHIIYINKKARFLLGIPSTKNLSLKDYLDENIFFKIKDDNFSEELLQIDDTYIIFKKTKLYKYHKETLYYINLRTASSIHDDNSNLSKKLKQSGHYAKYSLKDIWHQSDEMKKCIKKIEKVSETDYTVLIKGETGTGKELVAQSIHNLSKRKKNPFVAINCSAIPDNLIESELFGYEKGAFTDSLKEGKIGLFEQADGGTIFLDEIGDVSLSTQLKLLRTLEEKEIRRIGSNSIINIDVRLIAATNQNLKKAVTENLFRIDFLYRINTFSIVIPPLRERRDDITYIFSKMVEEDIQYLNSESKNKLKNYQWYGNVRELKNVSTYFKLMKELPVLQNDISNNNLMFDDQDLMNHMIKLIPPKQPAGIGRNKLLNTMRSQNIDISESKIEYLLDIAKQKGYIERRVGRAGTILTEDGIKAIQNNSRISIEEK